MAGILGLKGFNRSDGTNKLLAAYNSYVYELSGAAWVNKGPALTVSTNVEMEVFLDYVFRVNGASGDAMASYDATTWSTSTLVNNAPKGAYLRLFGRRMCVGNVGYASQLYPSRVWVSDNADANDNLTWGLSNGSDLATVGGSTTVFSNSGLFKTRNIKVGDSFVITSGSNAKTYIVSSVTNEKTIELTTAVTYGGYNQSYWVGSNYIDVKTDDGDVVTGLGDNSGRLLIFKRNSLHRWNGAGEAEEVKGSPGTSSHRSIVNLKNIPVTCYWSENPRGIFVYNGTKSVNVTRGIQDYLDGVSSTASPVAWRVGDLYKVYVGTITNTDKDIAISNAVIVFDASSGAIWFESLANPIQAVTEYVESNVTNLYSGDDVKNVYQLESGTTDNGTNFSWYIETAPRFPSGSELNKQFDGVEIVVQRGLGASVQYKMIGDSQGNDDQQWRSLGQLTNNLTSIPMPSPRGRGIRYRISREPIQEPIVLEKITTYYQVLNNPFL